MMIGRIRRLPGIFHGLASTCGGVNYTTGSRRLELALKLLLSPNAVPPRVKKGEGDIFYFTLESEVIAI